MFVHSRRDLIRALPQAYFRVATIGAVAFLLLASQGRAQASLAAENIINEIPITLTTSTGERTYKYTLLRDARNDFQWYYVPNEPRISEISVDGILEPEFELLRYASRDASNNLVFNGGGLLQFSASLSVPDGGVEQMKEAIISELNARSRPVPEHINLAALPFKSAEVSLYAPESGELLGGTVMGTGIAPTFSTQKMVFSVPLTQLGSDVYDALINGNTGVPIAVRFKYNGLTPPAGFSVDVDWRQAFSHYSENQEFRAQASYYGLFGASGGYSSTEIRERLTQSNAMKINIIEGEDLTLAQIDEYLQPIVKRINDGVLEFFKPPSKIDPAVAPATGGGAGWFASGSYSVAVKDVSLVKTGVERIDFRHSKIVERETVASGFIGVGAYDESIRDHLVNAADTSLWELAYLPLPAVPPAIDGINMTVRLVSGGRAYDSQNFSWELAEGWKDSRGEPADRTSFSLLTLKTERGEAGVEEATYDIRYVVEANNNNLGFGQSLPILSGDETVASPNQLVDVVRVDPGGLPWKAIDPTSELTRATVSISSGEYSFRQTFRTALVSGEVTEPPAVAWVLPRLTAGDQTPVAGQVEFRIGNQTRTWSFDDLRASEPSLEVFLDEVLSGLGS